jgi:hypothetical protein
MREYIFLKNVTTTILNEQMIKIKFVDLQKLYNFVVDFFNLNYFCQEKIRLNFGI